MREVSAVRSAPLCGKGAADMVWRNRGDKAESCKRVFIQPPDAAQAIAGLNRHNRISEGVGSKRSLGQSIEGAAGMLI